MNVKKYVVVSSLMFFAEISFGQNTFPPSGNVGIGTTSPRGQFDVAGTGDIFLSNNPIAGTGQSIYLPGHIFLAPYNGSDWTYLQARRFDNSGSTHLQFRTWNAGSLTDAMVITSIGRIGIGTYSPIAKLHIVSGGSSSSPGNASPISGDLVVQSNSVGRSSSVGASLEFVLPANSDGSNLWGQGRIITVAGSNISGHATGMMILGTRRYFDKGAGVQWNYGDDIVISGNGNVGMGTTTPIRKLHVSGTANTVARIEATDDGYASLEFAGNNKTWQLSKRPSVNYSDALQLYYHDGSTWSSPHVTFLPGGNVGIGTTTPGSFKLAVNGKIWGTEVQVALSNPGPDYVFEPTYDLKPLSEIETYIKENKHLPEVPSAKEMEANGVQLGEMNMLLLKKVEELTLHLIEQNRKLDEMKKENEAQNEVIKSLIDKQKK